MAGGSLGTPAIFDADRFGEALSLNQSVNHISILYNFTGEHYEKSYISKYDSNLPGYIPW